MKIKVSEATGTMLDWLVAKCEGWDSEKYMMWPDIRKDAHGKVIGIMVPKGRSYIWFRPSTDWAQGGPIIEREEIELHKWAVDGWVAKATNYMFLNTPQEKPEFAEQYGPKPLIAAMRCYVASKLGEEVEVPDGLR